MIAASFPNQTRDLGNWPNPARQQVRARCGLTLNAKIPTVEPSGVNSPSTSPIGEVCSSFLLFDITPAVTAELIQLMLESLEEGSEAR